MAESTPFSAEITEEYICPVCQEILQTPVRTQTCQHVFCRKCFLMAMKSGGANCPLCRGPVSKSERSAPARASDIDLEMRMLLGGCMYCGKQVKLHYMKLHYKSCRKYQEEYGLSPKDPTIQKDQKSTKCQDPKYKCPLCSEQNLSQRSLLEHCNNVHYYQEVEMVCPICATLPWGDPIQTTGNIIAHLNARHRFNYQEFMNIHLDEEAQFQKAIENSYKLSR
ncbi:hypothetical protein XENTR_v10016895 [Xenopus tropicalis]|uniref:E3 ubiquitin-protein ligase RNF138 n=1 Tax=Xenopus tropicalis TaxID=8364 RepID=B3DL31_XENTR|nr:ring finger protein 138 [Xenopus tropicalis]KAE8598658.1 hypothetical protein XENTR_v10016895 [Xenopus tropicalis]